MASMYVRVKRRRTTVFLHCEPTDRVADLKAKLEELLQEPPEAQRLDKGGAPLDDGATLREAGVETGDELALALRAPDGGWLEPEVEKPEGAPEDDDAGGA